MYDVLVISGTLVTQIPSMHLAARTDRVATAKQLLMEKTMMNITNPQEGGGLG